MFDTVSATAEVIRGEDAYAGVRVSMAATLLPAQLNFHVDVNVGDHPGTGASTTPEASRRRDHCPRLPAVDGLRREDRDRIGPGDRQHPLARLCDLPRRHRVDGTELHVAVRAVAARRGVELTPLREVLDGYAAIGQSRWAAWRRKQSLADRVPEDFSDAIGAVVDLADPAIGTAVGLHWEPASRRWQ